MKPTLVILPLVAALAIGTASAEQNKQKRQGDGQRTEAIASRLIENHDKNNDGALDKAELAEALKSMHKHRMKNRGEGKPKRPGNDPADAGE